MQIFLEIVKEGKEGIAFSIPEEDRYLVVFTINDDAGRRIFKSVVMEKGNVKIYASARDGMKDALSKLAPHSKKLTSDWSFQITV